MSELGICDLQPMGRASTLLTLRALVLPYAIVQSSYDIIDSEKVFVSMPGHGGATNGGRALGIRIQ